MTHELLLISYFVHPPIVFLPFIAAPNHEGNDAVTLETFTRQRFKASEYGQQIDMSACGIYNSH